MCEMNRPDPTTVAVNQTEFMEPILDRVRWCEQIINPTANTCCQQSIKRVGHKRWHQKETQYVIYTGRKKNFK